MPSFPFVLDYPIIPSTAEIRSPLLSKSSSRVPDSKCTPALASIWGMQPFETEDELYTCLSGDRPVDVLATARSKVDGKVYPMAFVLRYGKGRVFHNALGHDVRAITNTGAAELFRRGCAWAAGLAVVPSSEERTATKK